MKAEQKEKAALEPVFEKLACGFKSAGEGYSFSAFIGGRKASVCFPSQAHAEVAEQCFAGFRIPQEADPDVRFYFFSDDFPQYINQGTSPERKRYRDRNGWVIHLPNRWIIGADVLNRNFYYCMQDPEKLRPTAYWRVSTLVSQWAQAAGLLTVHGGAVGAEGKGVLLIAGSGGGKSTLAASSLLSGMDYVGDDYILVSAEGSLNAMPLFSTLKMNQDMREELEIDFPAICEDPAKKGKQLLDASSFPICGDLPIRSIIFLNREDRKSPEISPASGNIPVRLMQTALRTEGAYDPFAAKSVVQRLSKLPAYDMRLSGNLKQNADALRAWIERIK